jgi:hypothetical protein
LYGLTQELKMAGPGAEASQGDASVRLPKSNHGGKRLGAGRKPKDPEGHVVYTSALRDALSEAIADLLDDEKNILSPSALRQARARDRCRRGVALFKVELPIAPLVEWLQAAGWLTEDMNDYEPAIVESALQKALLATISDAI